MMQTMMIMYGGFAALMLLVVIALIVGISLTRLVAHVKARRKRGKLSVADSEAPKTILR